jgi:beta-1,4-N-acetylglucosaminyltransferase
VNVNVCMRVRVSPEWSCVPTRWMVLSRAGTCVPLCAAAMLLRFLGVGSTRIVFVESVCRVTSLSVTGLLLYPVADRFLVQWPQLQQRWPRTEHVGLLF